MAFENHVDQVMKDLMPNRYHLIHKSRIDLAKIAETDPGCIEFAIAECSSPEDTNDALSIMLRNTGHHSFMRFLMEYDNHQLQKVYPFLGMFFYQQTSIELLRYLLPVIKWHKIVTKLKSRQLRREDARKQKVVDIIYDETLPEKDREELKHAFKSFQEAWNSLRWVNQKDGTFDDIEMPQMHENVIFAEAVLDSVASPVYQIVEKLVSIQNDFLDDILKLAASTNCPAICFLGNESGTATVPAIPVQEVSQREIITFVWSEEILKTYSQFKLQYGLGKEVIYDFNKIEMELGNEIVLGKAYLNLDTSFPMFEFTGELFLGSEDILQEVKKLILQEDLSPDIINGVQAKKDKNPRYTSDLLTKMEVVLCLLKRTGGQPHQTLLDYTEEWLSLLTSAFPRNLLPDPAEAVKLCHVVGLYELLEDLLSVAAIDSLPDTYRVPLSEELQNDVTQFLNSKSIDLKHIVTTLKRFIFRYTNSSEDTNTTALLKMPLVSLLSAPSMWPDDVCTNGKLTKTFGSTQPKELKDVIPPGLCVEHVYSVLKFVEKTIEQIKDKEAKTGAKYSLGTPQIAGRMATRKGRRRNPFSKT